MNLDVLRRIAIALVVSGVLSAAAPPPAPEPRAGDPAPAFALRDLGGVARTLAEFRGRVLVVYFAMWCSTCRANTLEIQREIALPWRERGVQALAVDYLGNDREEIASLVKDLGLTYPVLFDDGTLTGLFGSRMAFTLVVDRAGVIRYADFYDLTKVREVVAELAGGTGESPSAAPSSPEARGPAVPRPTATLPAAGAERPAVVPDAWRRPVQSFPGRAPSEHLGIAVLARPADLNGDGLPDLVVGSQATEGRRGAVSVWYGGAQGFKADPDLTLVAPEPGRPLGGSLLAADLNGDGLQDLVVGDGWARGRVRTVSLHLGTRRGLSRDPVWTLRLGQGDAFGGALAAGDLDGDGHVDLVVGVHTPDRRGAIHVYCGRPGGLPSAPDAVIRGEATRDEFGASVAVVDLDGDGLAELVVGAPGVNGEGTDRGAAYLFVGRKGCLGRSTSAGAAERIVEGESDMDEFGSLVASAGDLDADRVPELAVAAPGSSRGGRRAGAVFLYRGLLAKGAPAARRLPAGAADRILADGAEGALFGVSVAAVGDLDGDGIDDLAVGAMNAQADPARAGAVFLYRGDRERRPQPPEIILGSQVDGRFGRDIAPLGGSRFVVTETGNGQRASGAGAAHVFAFPRTRQEAECSLCGMPLDRHRHTRYEALAKDGSTRSACGAQCGLRIEAALRESLHAAKATDFITGRMADAEGMFYVYGSDAVPEMWPSVIAFTRRVDAERFQRGFGGEVLDHAAALERVRRLR
jgi:peroxiredoxin